MPREFALSTAGCPKSMQSLPHDMNAELAVRDLDMVDHEIACLPHARQKDLTTGCRQVLNGAVTVALVPKGSPNSRSGMSLSKWAQSNYVNYGYHANNPVIQPKRVAPSREPVMNKGWTNCNEQKIRKKMGIHLRSRPSSEGCPASGQHIPIELQSPTGLKSRPDQQTVPHQARPPGPQRVPAPWAPCPRVAVASNLRPQL